MTTVTAAKSIVRATVADSLSTQTIHTSLLIIIALLNGKRAPTITTDVAEA